MCFPNLFRKKKIPKKLPLEIELEIKKLKKTKSKLACLKQAFSFVKKNVKPGNKLFFRNLRRSFVNNIFKLWDYVQKDGFLCAAFGTRITLHLNRRIGSGLVGGEGFILQRLEGNGKAFVHAGGTVIEKDLDREILRIDTGCIVAFESRVDFTVETAGSLKSMVFGGEGLFLATLRGPGKIWLQSMPFRKLIQAISPYGRNIRKGSSSILGNLLEG